MNTILDDIATRVADRVTEKISERGPTKPTLLTVEQAATCLGRSCDAIQHMIAHGKLPTVRLDRRVFLDREDLDKLIDGCKLAA